MVVHLRIIINLCSSIAAGHYKGSISMDKQSNIIFRTIVYVQHALYRFIHVRTRKVDGRTIVLSITDNVLERVWQ